MDFAAAPAPRWVLYLLLAFAFVAGALGTSVLLLPPRLGYVVEADRVVVTAGMGPLDHGFAIDRTSIEKVQPAQLVGGRKRHGSDGFGLCAGSWQYPAIGRVTQATSCGRQGVLITTSAGGYLLSPADPAQLVAELPPGRAAPPGTPPVPIPVAPAEGGPAWLRWALGLPMLVLLALLPRLLRPVRYTVADGVLTVPAFFAPVRVRLAGARVRAGPMRGIRLGGAAAPGLYLGNFRDRGGFYHAAATVREGLWIQGDRRVFVSPADAPAFVAALVASGAELTTE